MVGTIKRSGESEGFERRGGGGIEYDMMGYFFFTFFSGMKPSRLLYSVFLFFLLLGGFSLRFFLRSGFPMLNNPFDHRPVIESVISA